MHGDLKVNDHAKTFIHPHEDIRVFFIKKYIYFVIKLLSK